MRTLTLRVLSHVTVEAKHLKTRRKVIFLKPVVETTGSSFSSDRLQVLQTPTMYMVNTQKRTLCFTAAFTCCTAIHVKYKRFKLFSAAFGCCQAL